MDHGRWRRWSPADQRRCAVAATVAVLVVMAGAAVVAATSGWRPVSDWALLELQVRDVGGAHTPLVGAYRRFGWNHPGPWPVWLLTVPYRLVGSSPIGLLLGAVAFKSAVVVGTARVAWRRGGLALTLVTLVASSLLLRAVGVGGLLDPWNPWLAAPAVAWFCFLAWDLASGHRWSLPLAVAIGSLAVQAHLGVAVVVAALGATAVLLVAFGPGRDREAADGPRWARVLLVSAVVAAVLWAPTVVEQATGDPGNSRQILSFFLGDGSDGATTYFGTPAEPTGWHDGLAVLSRETVGPAPWLGGAEPRTLLGAVEGRSPVLLAVPVGLLLVTAFVGRRLRRPELWIAAVLGGVAMAAAAVSVARILGEPFDYLVRWVWPIALFVHVMAAWSVVLAVRAREEARIRLPDRRPAMAWTAVGLLLVVSTMSLDAGAGADGPHSAWESAVASLAPPAVAWAEDHDDGPVFVRSDGALVIIPPAIVLALDRAHQDVVVDESLAGVLPDYRHRHVEATTTLVLAGPEATARLDRDRRAVRLADDPGDPSSDAMPPIALFAIEAP